jgi:hypothetical protein
MNENTMELAIPGARGRVEVVGTRGIFYRVTQGGRALKRTKGRWVISLKNGHSTDLRSSGWIPGFQSLWLGGTKVYQFGNGVPIAARVVAFLPLSLIALNPYVGGVVGLVLVFYNLIVVKSPLFPQVVRIMLPVAHTVAGVLVVLLINGTVGGS